MFLCLKAEAGFHQRLSEGDCTESASPADRAGPVGPLAGDATEKGPRLENQRSWESGSTEYVTSPSQAGGWQQPTTATADSVRVQTRPHVQRAQKRSCFTESHSAITFLLTIDTKLESRLRRDLLAYKFLKV